MHAAVRPLLNDRRGVVGAKVLRCRSRDRRADSMEPSRPGGRRADGLPIRPNWSRLRCPLARRLCPLRSEMCSAA